MPLMDKLFSEAGASSHSVERIAVTVGPGSFTVQAQMPDVDNVERNSRVRVGDVNVGTVTEIERQGWNALVTMSLDGDVVLPANATAKVGQTSLLGSQHIELSAPTDTAPEGRLKDGAVIPLASAGAFPSGPAAAFCEDSRHSPTPGGSSTARRR